MTDRNRSFTFAVLAQAARLFHTPRIAFCAAALAILVLSGCIAGGIGYPVGPSALGLLPPDGTPWSRPSVLIGMEPPEIEEEAYVEQPDGVEVEVVARGLEVPWALAFTPDGRILVTERRGRIRLIESGALRPEPFASVDAYLDGESGLLGVAVGPDFASSRYVYVYYTYLDEEENLWNRVLRLKDVGGYGEEPAVILDRIPAGPFHDGGRIKFGPDGKLYIATGEARQPQIAQDLKSLGGKILRINADGSIPPDNPFPGSPVYSYGHRNPQGMAWHPVTGKLYVTEHGPTGEFRIWDNDELNIVRPGGNHGWPRAVGAVGLPGLVDPVLVQTPAVAPSGITFYDGKVFPEWSGSLFVATLKGQQLQRIVLKGEDFSQIARMERLFIREDGEAVYGRLREVVVGPDGAIYLTTSNRDGRGQPRGEDDMVLRLVPEGADSTSLRPVH